MRRYLIRLALLVAGALFLPGPVDAQVHFGLPSAVKSVVKKLKNKKNTATVSSIILSPLTTVLTADTNSKLFSVSPDSVTYHYDISATQLAGLSPGAILLSSQGDGLLKKIVSINTTSTEYIVQTTTATLEEAFQNLDVSFTQTFTPSQVSPQYLKRFSPQSVSLGQFEISTSVALSPNVTADVTLTFTPSIDGKIKIDWFQLKEFSFTSTFDGQMSYSLTTGAAETLTKGITVTEFPLGVIMAGPVPIVANYAIKVGIEANLQAAVTTGVTQDVSFESGVSYLNGIWTPHNTLSNTFTFTPLTGSAEGSVKGYIAPKINTKIFNVAGPYVDMEGYLKGIVTTPLIHLPWAIKGGVAINGGAEVDVLGVALAKYTVELYNAEIQLSSGTFFNQSPAISAVTPNPISVSTGGATTITCAASDSDSDTLMYTWAAASGAVSGTGSQITWTAPITPSTYTVTCGVADGWGGFVQKSTNVVVSATNHPPVIISVTANPVSISTGAATTITCAASDPDNNTLTYDWVAASGTISGIGSAVTWIAPASSSTYSIGCIVTDDKGAYVHKSTNVVVTATLLNHAPVITSLTANPASVSAGVATTITCTASDTDNDILTYNWGAASGTISGSGAQVIWTAPISSSTYLISCTVSDGKGGSAQQSVNVAVSVPHWEIETVDSVGSVGSNNSIALDTNNYPHISYLDVTNNDLKYAKWTGSSWSTQTIDSVGLVGWRTSIALDSNNNPHIVYLDGTNNTLKYAKWTGASWSIETIEGSDSGWGHNTSIMLDASNYPHIAYFDTTRHPKYARWNGVIWIIQGIDLPNEVRDETISLALDSNYFPHVAYTEGINNGYDEILKYAKWNGVSWSTQTIETSGVYEPFLKLDSNNNPHIVYRYFVGENTDIKYTKWDGVSWSSQTVKWHTGTASSEGNVSLALNQNGNPSIAFNNWPQGEFQYAKWNGAAWDIEVFNSIPWGSPLPMSMTLGTNGYPHISYFSGQAGDDLKYAIYKP